MSTSRFSEGRSLTTLASSPSSSCTFVKSYSVLCQVRSWLTLPVNVCLCIGLSSLCLLLPFYFRLRLGSQPEINPRVFFIIIMIFFFGDCHMINMLCLSQKPWWMAHNQDFWGSGIGIGTSCVLAARRGTQVRQIPRHHRSPQAPTYMFLLQTRGLWGCDWFEQKLKLHAI